MAAAATGEAAVSGSSASRTTPAVRAAEAGVPPPSARVPQDERPAPAPQAAQDEQPGTRNKVARSLLDHGPSTAAEVALRLELTQAAVRRHLDALTGEGVVEARAKRVYGSRGRGRPAKVFALTDCGRDAFDQAYDELAADALRWIAQQAGGGEVGEAAIAAFARARVEAQAEKYHAALAGVPPEDRARALARALSEDGYAATAREAPAQAGEQLCQHHCPVAHTAEQFPQLCEAETEVFSRLLGTHVQRLATIAHGDGVCTTFVPGAQPKTAAQKPPPRPQAPAPPQTSAPPTTAISPKTRKTSSTATHANEAGRNPA
ncbi:ArsR family transcriptional regulator [Streptomyces diacarni]|uniref:ArsR family transcriptional regulator n=1 Tax=Streptomyces diacarni TaxID=2800381 RepID=A0A367F8L8_9ACTN|nr:ArsR family transcriptional regulator [Streptomyces diacarni]RCG26694.1 ArsR family transcriptional regulator [Streptomyces diacarni]